jgi:hypothetical protein
MPSDSHAELRAALARLRGLKGSTRRPERGNAPSLTDEGRSAPVSSLGAAAEIQLTSGQPASEEATSSRAATEVVTSPHVVSGATLPESYGGAMRLSAATWFGIVTIVIATIGICAALVTYFHGDLKTDIRELREQLREEQAGHQSALDQLRARMRSVESAATRLKAPR